MQWPRAAVVVVVVVVVAAAVVIMITITVIIIIIIDAIVILHCMLDLHAFAAVEGRTWLPFGGVEGTLLHEHPRCRPSVAITRFW